MKTKEEILEEVCQRHFAQDRELSWKMALEAMEKYAKQRVKNLNIFAVINRRELLIAFLKYIEEGCQNPAIINKEAFVDLYLYNGFRYKIGGD